MTSSKIILSNRSSMEFCPSLERLNFVILYTKMIQLYIIIIINHEPKIIAILIIYKVKTFSDVKALRSL